MVFRLQIVVFFKRPKKIKSMRSLSLFQPNKIVLKQKNDKKVFKLFRTNHRDVSAKKNLRQKNINSKKASGAIFESFEPSRCCRSKKQKGFTSQTYLATKSSIQSEMHCSCLHRTSDESERGHAWR